MPTDLNQLLDHHSRARRARLQLRVHLGRGQQPHPDPAHGLRLVSRRVRLGQARDGVLVRRLCGRLHPLLGRAPLRIEMAVVVSAHRARAADDLAPGRASFARGSSSCIAFRTASAASPVSRSGFRACRPGLSCCSIFCPPDSGRWSTVSAGYAFSKLTDKMLTDAASGVAMAALIRLRRRCSGSSANGSTASSRKAE